MFPTPTPLPVAPKLPLFGQNTSSSSFDECSSDSSGYDSPTSAPPDATYRGIVSVPVMFEEDCRTTLVYPLHRIDLFDFFDVLQKCAERGDLKIENLLLYERGDVVIGDFELAHVGPPSKEAAGEFVEDVAVVGTPMYIPPKVLEHRRMHTHKSDTWSLGVIAWEMVSNSNPWRMHNDEVSLRHLLVTTKNTKKGGFEKEEDMSEELLEFIVGCVYPVDERLTPSETMQLPFFKGLSGDLFPEVEGREDLNEVAQLLVIASNQLLSN